MKFTRSRYGLKALLLLLCFGIQYGLLDAKAIKKSKHAVHKSGSQKNNVPKGNFCVDHSYCVKYSDLDCASSWVEQNCPRMCRVCEYEGPDIMQLPAVLYVKKGNKKHGISGKRKHKSKHATEHKVVDKRDETPGGRRDVVFLSKQYDNTPTKMPPTTSYNLFDYSGNYRKWLFMFPDQHPVNLHYVDQKKAADTNQQTAGQQQTVAGQDAAGMPAVSAGVATPTLAPVAPTAAQLAAPAAPGVAQSAAPAVAAAPVAPAAPAAAVPAAPTVAQPAAEVPQVGQVATAVQQPAAPVAAQQPVAAQAAAAAVQPLAGTQSVFTNQSQVIAPANQTIELINQTVSLATNNTQPPVYGFGAAGFEPNVANVAQTNGTVMAGAFEGNNTSNQTFATGSVDLTSTGQSFTQDVTVDSDGAAQTPWTCCKNVKPPKDCKPCPKLPKAPPLPYVFNIYCDDLYKDCGYAYSNCNDTWWQINCPKTCNLCKAKDKVTAPKTKAILPKEVKDLDTSELESDLVAPVPGEKPLVAKYTLRVKPKLLNGVPQMQEIRIMPPNKSGASGFVKPLMVLKQNITKPMIENIEIDVPKKGAKYSRKPSVEVIEGDHKEMLQVSKGQAVVEDASQKSNTKPEEIQETKPAKDSEASTEQLQSSSTNTTKEDSAAKPATAQTQSTSTTTPEQDSAAQTSTAQAQSTSTTQTDAQSTASYQPDTQTQSASTTQAYAQSTASYQQDTQTQSTSTAPATQTAAYSNTETCTDDSRCAPYAESQCADAWLMTNCKSKCKLC